MSLNHSVMAKSIKKKFVFVTDSEGIERCVNIDAIVEAVFIDKSGVDFHLTLINGTRFLVNDEIKNRELWELIGLD